MTGGLDLVKQFDEMRQTLTPQLAAIQPPAPPAVDQPYTPSNRTAPPVTAATPTAAPAAVAGARKPGKLVSWNGRQLDEGVVPYAQQLAGMGLRLTSAYRSPEQNARTPGAAKNSHHMSGRAVDFVGSAKAMQQGAAWARANGAREVLVHNAGTGQHLHAAW